MTPPEPYRALTAALRERLEIIADRKAYALDATAHMERLKATSERIAALQAGLPPPVDPRLTHFLQRCSYDKALALMESDAGQAR